jgi:hypothetical protein
VSGLAAEIYNSYRSDEKMLDRLLAREELAYYATALLWIKLLQVKSKQGNKAPSSAEKGI